MSTGLALFDFDGTITSKDSMLEFLKFSVGKTRYMIIMALFSPLIIYYIYFKKDGENAKRMLLAFLFKGKSKATLSELGQTFAGNVIPGILFGQAMNAIEEHKKQGHRIVVISASLDIWLEPWAHKEKVELICTRLEFSSGRFTGRFATPNCNGEEKVRRILAHLDIGQYSPVYAYGNSSGDKPMLALADYKFFRHFGG